MIKRLFILCFLFNITAFAVAQKPAEPPAQFLTKIKFDQLTGGVILMKAQFDQFEDTLNFILDTGSGGISLDSATAAYFNLVADTTDREIRGIGGVRNLCFLRNKQLRLPHLTVDSLDFHVLDYGMLTAVYGYKIDGIIGYALLKDHILKINYDSLHIEIWSKGEMTYPKGGFILKPYIGLLPVHHAQVKDAATIKSRLLFDIGAGLNLMLSSDFVRDSNLLLDNKKFFTKEAEGMGGKLDMHLTVIKEVKLGPYKFKKVPVYVFDDVHNVTSYPHVGGLMGNDLLRRFNVILDYGKKTFHLKPNSHFREAFDYSYTGIELYYLNGEVILGDVAKDSPAEKAGLKEGDVVVAINKNFSNELLHLRAELQKQSGWIDMVVSRDGELLKYAFKVKSIL